MRSPSPAAVAAAEWWAEQVGAPTFRNTDDRDSAEDRALGGFAGVMADMLAEAHPVGEREGKRFAEVLAPEIQERIDRGYGATLGVDYGPDQLLADAATQAGVSLRRFPWKTHMWAHADHVVASLGYRGRHRLVWASDEWLANRPACGSQRWDESRWQDADYYGDPFVCSLPKYHDEPCQYDQPITLCAECGRPDDWYCHGAERRHMPDFHEFAETVRPG